MPHKALQKIPGVDVQLDKLVYHYGGITLPSGCPHAFIYFLTIRNQSHHSIVLLGRKWIIRQESGECTILEGDKIVGQTPRLHPGESFSYNSYHVTCGNAEVSGSFHGINQLSQKIVVPIPAFSLKVPTAED